MRIAVTGKIRSGKNTLAKHFSDKGFFELAFGDGIKDVIRDLYPEQAKVKNREMYQVLGQTLRKFDKDIWVKKLEMKLIMLEKQRLNHFIVTDMRQQNEYEFLKSVGFIVVKVEADEELRKERVIEAGDIFSPESFHHETELAVDQLPYDYLVTNNDTLEALIEQAEFIYNDLRSES